MMAKYRTTLKACSCPGYWYRRTCRHIIKYREARALVEAQNAVNTAYSPIGTKSACIGSPIGVKLTPIGVGVRGPL